MGSQTFQVHNLRAPCADRASKDKPFPEPVAPPIATQFFQSVNPRYPRTTPPAPASGSFIAPCNKATCQPIRDSAWAKDPDLSPPRQQ